MHEIKTEKYKGFFPLKVALFLLAAAILVTLVSWQMRIAEKSQELESLQAQLTTQQLRNKEVENTLENSGGLKDYAEKKARRDLDYAKPGERIFVDVGGSD